MFISLYTHLLHKTDNTWVLIVFSIEMLRKSDHEEYDTDEVDDRQEYETNEDKYQNSRNTRVEDKTDIKVDDFIADFFFLRCEFIFAYEHIDEYEDESKGSS